MTFKSFMEQCDDTITEEEALSKYCDYKLEFKRQQLNEFFINHKEEEWWVGRGGGGVRVCVWVGGGVCVCVGRRERFVCVYVGVCERERERGRKKGRK